ncbi:transposase [Streptomyces europaeiscabiei]|nr:transposase [Streptomyces scabiei]MDX3586084.1 transposase [Streptomyces europaeiscabiei]MDX3635437.1 transposase [Streptomyces europaeiscabiei]MDX3653668.1 transposase [Streptomyces europaeiscabiei]
MSTWRAERRRHALDIGRPPEHDLREIMNAILYVDPTGVQGRCLPHDFPPFRPATATSPSGRRTAR